MTTPVKSRHAPLVYNGTTGLSGIIEHMTEQAPMDRLKQLAQDLEDERIADEFNARMREDARLTPEQREQKYGKWVPMDEPD
ncbi:hypothetical protein GCM10007304_14800 [Rhodococcoides trifolii]|uniref:Uncharacterized protein n=2 Tax=Rhodococcoides trifolii TaxID=908250 RepID=A0A917CXQ7_9NOCA|nr:hypothetical protein GCM10007304_14800 [Rhodococcus trifolii]